jgi:SAM-dependent methyltransferase
VDWSEGYVTDVGYTRGYYRELNASWQSFALAATGYEPPNINAPFTKVELGCGYGLSLLMEAAAFPHAQFYGVDFNPDHITWAKRIAAQAGITNVHYLELSFADLLGSGIPDCDFVAMHGVWTWVSEENRQKIKQFLDRRLKSGGVNMVSYNALPAWSTKSGLRELMLAKFRSTAGSTEARIKEALAFAIQCRDSGAPIFSQSPVLSEHLDRLTKLPTRYLAHEYFNEDWHLFYQHQVADAMASVRLSYLGAAKLMENFDKFNFQSSVLKLFEQVSPRERELLRDIYLNRPFRFDMYGRGLEQIGLFGSSEHILNSTFVLSDARSKLADGAIKTAIGVIKLRKDLYDPILTRLEQGPAQAKEFMTLPGARPLALGEIVEALAIFLDVGVVSPARPMAELPALQARAQRLNDVLIERTRKGEDIGCLLSPISGLAHGIADYQKFFVAALKAGQDPVSYAWVNLKASGKRMIKGDTLLQSAEENLKELEERLSSFQSNFAPRLKHLGIL